MKSKTKSMPSHGLDSDRILGAMQELRDGDAKWEDGKVWCLVYSAGAEISDFLKKAYTMYFSENALNPGAFPSLKQMEAETVAMTASLLGGDEQTVGNMTSGGTESILMAIKAAREWGKARGIKTPKIVLPTSAHPAFPKACHYFGVEAVWVPVAKDFRADVRAMKKAITRDTVMIVGSAPSYPQGVVDPIEEIAAIAKQKGILCHVDACVGGFMLPFVRALGRHVPPFDFSVPGVTSMSVDLHKYGYAAKGASVVLYADPELRKHMYYSYADWPGGIYVAPVMGGTRPGGAIAAAWAIMHRLGFEGYTEIAGEVMAVTDKLRDGINAIDGIGILGDPAMSVMAIGSDTHDVYKIGDEMTVKGWHIDRQQNPNSLHITINHAHITSADQFLEDLADSVRAVDPKTSKEIFAEKAQKIALGAIVSVLPRRVVSKATTVISEAMGMAGDSGDLPERSAAMYGMIANLPNRGDINTFAIDALDKMFRYDPDKEIEIPAPPTADVTQEE